MDGFSGSIRSMPMRDVVLYIGTQKLSGALVCKQDGEAKSVLVSRGLATMATSSHPNEYFSHLLVDYGFVTAEQLAQAVAQSDGDKLGRVLVRLGMLDEARVREALHTKIRDTLVAVMGWTHGAFVFEETAQVTAGVDVVVDMNDLWHEIYDAQAGEGDWAQLHQVLQSRGATSAVASHDTAFAETFRRDVELRLAERGRGKRFPKDLQRRAVSYYRTRTEQGSFLSEVARELGLPPPTLRRWVLDSPPDALPAAVGAVTGKLVLTPQGPGQQPVLVGPNGLRIEGLDVSTLAELLRRLEA